MKEVGSTRPPTAALDLAPAPDVYKPYLPNAKNAMVLVRASDGIHFTTLGYDMVMESFYPSILASLKQRGRDLASGMPQRKSGRGDGLRKRGANRHLDADRGDRRGGRGASAGSTPPCAVEPPRRRARPAVAESVARARIGSPPLGAATQQRCRWPRSSASPDAPRRRARAAPAHVPAAARRQAASPGALDPAARRRGEAVARRDGAAASVLEAAARAATALAALAALRRPSAPSRARLATASPPMANWRRICSPTAA